jgi:hypothetical protein
MSAWQSPWTDAELSAMSFLDLVKLREQNKSKAAQNHLAPYEHQAFVRYATQEDGPLMGGLLAAGGAPYYLAKKLSSDNFGARSDPSLGQIGAGLMGFGQGLQNWNASKVKTKVRDAGLLPYTEPDLPSIATRAAPMTDFAAQQDPETPATPEDIAAEMKRRAELKQMLTGRYLQTRGGAL